MSYGKLAGCAKLLFGTHRRELEPSAARPSGQGALLGRVSTSRSAAIRRSERTTTIVPSLGAFASERTCLKQTPIIPAWILADASLAAESPSWRSPALTRRSFKSLAFRRPAQRSWLPRLGQAARAGVALTGRHGRLPRLRPRFRHRRTVGMRSASAEACGACRQRPWLKRTPRCGLRTRPLRTVLYVLRRRAAAARGWDAPCAPGSGMALAPATLAVEMVPTTCRTHPCTLAPQVIQQSQPLYRDPATTWSNGYELC